MPTLSEISSGLMPRRSNSSAITSEYDGVTMMTSGLKSMICWTCFSVWPPDIGTAVQPARSMP